MVGDGEVEDAVGAEIAGIDRTGAVAGGEFGAGAEGASAIAEQDGDGVVLLIDDGQIQAAIGVEVASDHSDGVSPHREVLLGAKRAVAIPQQNRDCVPDFVRVKRVQLSLLVGDGQVEFAIGVEIADGDRVWSGAGGEIGPGAEGAVAVAEQDGNSVVGRIGDGQVALVVVVDVEVAGGDGAGLSAGGKVGFCAEEADAGAEKNGDVAGGDDAAAAGGIGVGLRICEGRRGQHSRDRKRAVKTAVGNPADRDALAGAQAVRRCRGDGYNVGGADGTAAGCDGGRRALIGDGQVCDVITAEVCLDNRNGIVAGGEVEARDHAGRIDQKSRRERQAGREDGQADGEAVADEEGGRLRVLRAHQDAPGIAHQAERLGKISRRAGQGGQKARLAAAKDDKWREQIPGANRGRTEDALNDALQALEGAQRFGDGLRREREDAGRGGRGDAELLCLVAVELEQFDFEHHLGRSLFELFDQRHGHSDVFGRVAQGKRAAAGVEVGASDAGNLAHQARDFGHAVHRGCVGERNGAGHLRSVVLALLRRVLGDKKTVSVHGPPERVGLKGQHLHRRRETHAVNAQANRARGHVPIEEGLQAKLVGDFFVGAARVAAEVEIARARLGLHPGGCGGVACGGLLVFFNEWCQLRQTLTRHRIARVFLKSRLQLRSGLIGAAGQGRALGLVGVTFDQAEAGQLPTQGVLRLAGGVAGGLPVGLEGAGPVRGLLEAQALLIRLAGLAGIGLDAHGGRRLGRGRGLPGEDRGGKAERDGQGESKPAMAGSLHGIHHSSGWLSKQRRLFP